MDSTSLIVGIIGGASTIIASFITYIGTKGNKSNDTKLRFETTDYIKHLRSHNLPLEGIEQSFKMATSIDELSERLKKISSSPLNCEYFEPILMKSEYLTSINNARKTLNLKPFNNEGSFKEV